MHNFIRNEKYQDIESVLTADINELKDLNCFLE